MTNVNLGPEFNRTVDALVRARPDPTASAHIRVAELHSGQSFAPALRGAGVSIVHSYRPILAHDRLDFKQIPEFDLVVADVSASGADLMLESVFRFLWVRRPPAFVLTGAGVADPGFRQTAEKKAQQMGYQLSAEEARGHSLTFLIGTLRGTVPIWIPTEIGSKDGSPEELELEEVVRRVAELVRVRTR